MPLQLHVNKKNSICCILETCKDIYRSWSSLNFGYKIRKKYSKLRKILQKTWKNTPQKTDARRQNHFFQLWSGLVSFTKQLKCYLSERSSLNQLCLVIMNALLARCWGLFPLNLSHYFCTNDRNSVNLKRSVYSKLRFSTTPCLEPKVASLFHRSKPFLSTLFITLSLFTLFQTLLLGPEPANTVAANLPEVPCVTPYPF